MKTTEKVLNWDTEQIKAYAAAFREGDAIQISNLWYKVVKDTAKTGLWQSSSYGADAESVVYRLNFYDNGTKCYEGIINGFLPTQPNYYEITTLNNYASLKEGDKIVWLDDSSEVRTFGKSYIVTVSNFGSGLTYKDDNGNHKFISNVNSLLWNQAWGVIPTHKNIEERK